MAISVSALGKTYQLYDRPSDRLLQMLLGKRKPLYQNFCALRDVSFQVRRGETVGIVGRNGSGKSTLLQLICGTLNPTAGAVSVKGRIAALLELGSGFNHEFTGRENVYLNGTLLGMSRDQVKQRFDTIERFADIGEFIDHPVKTYSSGMMVRLAFAVAANVDAQVLIIDEALSVGDELFQRKCFAHIEALKQAGATILFVSHSSTTVVELCDRTLLLDSGELLASGAPKIIMGQYQKLLYAPADKRDAVRAEIRDTPRQDALMLAQEGQPDVGGAVFPHQTRDYFDPHLKPQSTIEYESLGAHIEAPEIWNLAGEQVNCLVPGRRYRYTYRIHFDKAATSVRFGMLIKTVAGVEIGGATSAKNPLAGIDYVAAGTTLHVEYGFTCRLNEGIYFLNAGVSGDVGDGFCQLSRLVDAACFRVAGATAYSIGVVDFDCQPEWSYFE